MVSPLQTSVGNDIDLSAQAVDEEGDPIHYSGPGDGGSIADPSAASTTYTCQEVGDHTVTIMVTDNDVYCRMATWTIPVTCVEGDGGDLCEDVMCEDDGNECTESGVQSGQRRVRDQQRRGRHRVQRGHLLGRRVRRGRPLRGRRLQRRQRVHGRCLRSGGRHLRQHQRRQWHAVQRRRRHVRRRQLRGRRLVRGRRL